MGAVQHAMLCVINAEGSIASMMVKGQQTRQGKKGTRDFQRRFSLFESEGIRFQPQSAVNCSLTAQTRRPAHMEEGGAHQSRYVTWLLHHLVAVLCNDANGEKEEEEKKACFSGRQEPAQLLLQRLTMLVCVAAI